MSDFSAPAEVSCYWAPTANAKLVPSKITRRAMTADDVVIAIKYAGICHSDIHQVRAEWSANGLFPMVPGHEIVGDVVAVGHNVANFKAGDRAGVGCMVDSCRTCKNCVAGEEQYCRTGAVFTYNSKHKYPHCAEYNAQGGTPTYGGYSKIIVVDYRYVVRVPETIPYHTAAPLLCAGITVYSPMRYFGLKPEHKFAVAGLGGLGHMAVKFGVAMGCHTTVISRGTSKRDNAINELKANAYIDSSNADEMKAAVGQFDFILSTISAQYDVQAYMRMLTTNGKFVVVGVPPGGLPMVASGLIGHRHTVAGSLIGGIAETQEMLNFCGEKEVTSDVEVITVEQINDAYDRAVNSDVKYRFVIDIDTLA